MLKSRLHVLVCTALVCGCQKEPEAQQPSAGAHERAVARSPEEARIQERAAADAMFMVTAGDLFQATLTQAESAGFSLPMRAGLCYKVLGEGDSHVRDLDILVTDANGVLVQRDGTVSAHPLVGYERAVCPNETALYRIDVRVAAGAGALAVQAFVSQ